MTRLRWAEPAETDFLQIYDHIAESDPRSAERVGLQLLDTIASLERFPRRGRPGRLPGTRGLVVSGLPWIVVYRVRGTGRRANVTILRVVHGARNWPGRRSL